MSKERISHFIRYMVGGIIGMIVGTICYIYTFDAFSNAGQDATFLRFGMFVIPFTIVSVTIQHFLGVFED